MYKLFLMILALGVAACAAQEPLPQEPSTGTQLNLIEACQNEGGVWLAEFEECEGISEQSCSSLGGVFDGCASACRNNPEAEFCTMQCVQVCDFDAEVPANCTSWFDGCNTCSVDEGELVACTEIYCEQYEAPRCLSYD